MLGGIFHHSRTTVGSILLCAAIAGCGRGTQEVPDAVSMFSLAKHSVVKVYGLSGELDGNRAGTGFAFSVGGKTSVVTNRHVVEKSTVVLVENGEAILKIPGWRTHPFLDLAVLELPPDSGLKPLDAGKAGDLSPGQKVYTVGYPLGEEISIHEGSVSSTDGSDLVFSAPISTGASGSPLLDSGGKVVGICHSFMPDAQNYNLAMPADFLSLDAEWSEKSPQPDPALGAYLEKIVEIKTTGGKSLKEWDSIVSEFPEWEDWTRRTMLTRRPLVKAMEETVLGIHSIDWSSFVGPDGGVGGKELSELLRRNVRALEAAWTLHRLNVGASQNLQPNGISLLAVSDVSIVPELIESAKQLAAAAGGAAPPKTGDVFAISPAPAQANAVGIEPSALAVLLQRQLLLEDRWKTGCLP